MRSEILVEVVGDEARVIVLEDGIPVDLIIERETKKSLIGNIYKGRVETINRGLGAAFIDLGEQTAGFLPVDQDDYPVEGESVWVQVREMDTKAKGHKSHVLSHWLAALRFSRPIVVKTPFQKK